MSEIKKFEGIFPSGLAKFRSILTTHVDMCDFMLSEPENKYSLTFTKIDDLKTTIKSFYIPIQNVKEKENELDQVRVILEDVKNENLSKITDYFNIIKASEGGTNDFVERYKIKGNTIAVDTDNLIADFKLKKVGQIFEFHFTKHGFKGLNMNFYIKHENETSYHLLFTALASPYEYKEELATGDLIFAVYNLKNKEVGQPSKILAVNF